MHERLFSKVGMVRSDAADQHLSDIGQKSRIKHSKTSPNAQFIFLQHAINRDTIGTAPAAHGMLKEILDTPSCSIGIEASKKKNDQKNREKICEIQVSEINSKTSTIFIHSMAPTY